MKLKLVGIICSIILTGCHSNQSALSPTGEGAIKIAELFWWMSGGALIVWLWVVGTGIYGMFVKPQEHNPKKTALFIITGGVIIPVIVLSFLIFMTIPMLPPLIAKAPPNSLEIEVSGAQWWWRVRYPQKDGSFIELANEIRVPVNEYVQLNLLSEDVIHSFWVPPLGGKMDMIPGRSTYLTLKPTKTGVYKGACAEYCGGAHAQMKLDFVVMEKEEFNQWLEHQKKPYVKNSNPQALRGEKLFLKYGCTACHTVRGLQDIGTVGPDLTHVGSRLSLGAGILPNQLEIYHLWLSRLKQVKPQVHMPEFDMVDANDLKAISFWLEGLK